MKFDKIVSVDYTGIDEFVHNELKELCNNLIIYNDFFLVFIEKINMFQFIKF